MKMKNFQFNPGNYFIVVIKVMSINTVFKLSVVETKHM